MTTLLEKLVERTSGTRLPGYVRDAFGYRGRVSAASGEFKRVAAVPRRNIDSAADWASVAEVLHEELRFPGSDQSLWDLQVKSLYEIALYGGAFLPIGVGRGKTLISLLAPAVLQAERPVLFVPADLREKTNAVSIPFFRDHWRLHPNLRVVGYSELSLAKNAEMLDELQPDLIVLDEVHSVKNRKAGRTRRLLRYLKEHDIPVVAMSGTITNKSLRDFAHLAEWCLRANSPLPLDWRTLCEWSDALDADVPDETRVHPGALMEWAPEPEDGDILAAARQGFRQRLVETPAVVASQESELGSSLVLRPYRPELSAECWSMMRHMRDTWTTPNGDDITEAMELWRHMREPAPWILV